MESGSMRCRTGPVTLPQSPTIRSWVSNARVAHSLTPYHAESTSGSMPSGPGPL